MAQFGSTTLGAGNYDSKSIERQRRMAEMLSQQGAEVIPAGQMVGNRFVPTPWTHGLAKALQSFGGAWLEKKAEDREKEKAQKLSEVLVDPSLYRDRIEGGAILGQTNQPAPGDITMPPPQAAPESLASGPQAMPPIGAPVPVGDPAGAAGGITMPEVTAPKVEVVGNTAPKMMTTAALIQALAQKHQETGVPMADLMQAFAPRIAQLSAMEKPTVLNQGDQMVNPLTGEVLAEGAPKPVTPKNRQIVMSGGPVGPDGRPSEVPMMLDDDGRAVPIEGVQPITKGPLATASATATTAADGKGLVKIAEAQAGNVAATAERAKVAQASIASNIDPMLRAIDSGKIVTGPTADQRVWLRQLGETMGVTGKSNQEVLTNTRTLIQGLASQELDAAIRMKGQGQITEAERSIIKRAASGEISTMTPPELRNLLMATRKVHLLTISQHQRNVEAVRKVPGAPTILPEWDVQTPSAYEPESPQPKAAAGAASIRPGTVADGYRFKGGNPNDPNAWEPVK